MNRPMRRQKCEVTDPVKIEQIIKKAGVVHLGMVDEGKAYIVPLHYGYMFTLQIFWNPLKNKYSIINKKMRRQAYICFLTTLYSSSN